MLYNQINSVKYIDDTGQQNISNCHHKTPHFNSKRIGVCRQFFLQGLNKNNLRKAKRRKTSKHSLNCAKPPRGVFPKQRFDTVKYHPPGKMRSPRLKCRNLHYAFQCVPAICPFYRFYATTNFLAVRGNCLKSDVPFGTFS